MGLRFTVPHLRWLVLAGIGVVLYVTVTSYMARKWNGQQSHPLPQKISADVDQQTQAFSLSKTLGQHTLYTVQAEQVTNFKDTGKAVLRNVSIVLHGSQGQRQDRISTAECEYDPISGLLVATGEVRMEFQSPPPDSEDHNGAAVAPVPVSISTTGLSFEQHTGIASTQQTVHFRFPQGEGQSRGATYNPETEWLTLPADVQLTLYEGSTPTGESSPGVSLAGKLPAPGAALSPAGTVTGNVTRIQAANLRFHRGQRRLLLGAPVEVVQDSRKLRAGHSEIVLDERHQARMIRLSSIQGTLQSAVTASNMQAASGRLELSENGKVQRLVLEQDVRWNSSTAHSHKEGSARRAELFFTEPGRTKLGSKDSGSLLDRIQADGGVRMVMRRSPVANPTARPQAGLQETIAGADTQILSAEQAEFFFASDGETLRRVRTDEASTLQILASQRSQDRWNVQASRFDMNFESEGHLASFRADGNVNWSAGVGSALRSSTSRALEAFIDPLTHSLTRIQQQGNFFYEDTEKQARAETAVYETVKEEVRLRGNPVVWNPSGKITAQEIVLDNARQRLMAQGNVSTTYFPEAAAGHPPPETLHGVAERLEYDLAAQRAQFEGRSRLWQGKNLLEAGSIELHGQRKEVVARQGVYSLWAGLASTGNSKPPSPQGNGALAVQRDTYEIWSDSLVYRDPQKQAHYQGGVRMFSSLRTLTAAELELFLRGAPTTGGGFDSGEMRLDRAVAQGDVRLAEPERTAQGNKAEYLPEAGNILLYGSPAVVVDSERGSLQGARLTYSIADDRIFVDSEPGVPAQTRWQVRR